MLIFAVAMVAMVLSGCSDSGTSSGGQEDAEETRPTQKVTSDDITQGTKTYVGLWVGSKEPTECSGTVRHDDGGGWMENETSGLFWSLDPGETPGRGLVLFAVGDERLALGDTVDFASMRLMLGDRSSFSPFTAPFVDQEASVQSAADRQTISVVGKLDGSLASYGSTLDLEVELTCSPASRAAPSSS